MKTIYIVLGMRMHEDSEILRAFDNENDALEFEAKVVTNHEYDIVYIHETEFVETT